MIASDLEVPSLDGQDKGEVSLQLTLHGHVDLTNSLPFNSVGDTVGQLNLPEVLRSSGHEFYK